MEGVIFTFCTSLLMKKEAIQVRFALRREIKFYNNDSKSYYFFDFAT